MPYQTKVNGFGHFPRFFIGSQKLSVVNTDRRGNSLIQIGQIRSLLSLILSTLDKHARVYRDLCEDLQPTWQICSGKEFDLRPNLLEKKGGPGFCLVATLQFLLKKTEYEKRHLVLNTLQDWVVLEL